MASNDKIMVLTAVEFVTSIVTVRAAVAEQHLVYTLYSWCCAERTSELVGLTFSQHTCKYGLYRYV